MNSLLISTMLNVIHYNNHEYNIIDSGKLEDGNAHFNGITWDEHFIYIAGCKNTKYGYYTYLKDFKVLGFVDNLDLHETHQIIKIKGTLYFVNTGLNRIEILDGDNNISHKSFNESTCDIDHLNGIWYKDDRFYISEFRHKQKDENGEQPSVVRICDGELNLLETIEIGLPIHNVYIKNNKMYNLVSREAGLSVIDLETRQKYFIHLPQLQGMLIRGLARSKNYWYIGASHWETERNKRHVGDGVILVLDNNFYPIEQIVMPNVGPICDIRIIDELDLAHNGVMF